MAKIQINNPRQIINGGAKKYYFKVKGLGGPKGDRGDKGDTGSRGPQGEPGNAATVYVGSTTTLPVGQDATVENVGTQYNAVLNFGIPQGPRGPQGIQGERGEPGQTGQTGPRGPQGEKGTNATVYIGTTSTLNPGSQATVYNSGTDSNAVLNFGIPKGEKGDTGPMPSIAQTTGQAIDQVMSQKATTDALNTKQAIITNSNKLSADLVTDTSTTNKFVTAEDKTTWNAKQNALTAGQGIDITSDVISTPALVPEVVASLPADGTDGKLYLTPKAHTSQTATGNPITATVAEDAGTIESFQLDGDTFQQSYTGKNLFNAETETSVFIDSSGNIIPGSTWSCSDYIKVSPNTTYSWHGEQTGSLGGQVIWAGYDSSQAFISGQYAQVNNTAGTSFTTGASTEYVRVGYRNDRLEKMQLELGSTASDYEPFVGGQPSPNPDYPQPIQTVTGEQTVTINSTDYPISLGSIELCKLGTYQDYIYKDGDDWKVHKAIGYILMSGGETENWDTDTSSGYTRMDITLWDAKDYGSIRKAIGYCDRFTLSIANAVGIFFANRNHYYFYPQATITTLEQWKSWLASNNTGLYYVLATPTDIVITDQTLIAQLEAIRTASLQNGANTITNSAQAPNLAGDMEIGYYGYNPRNRYDKWLWLDLNNNYEQIGS